MTRRSIPHDVEVYIKVRIEQLKDEFDKNPSSENNLIFTKAINELAVVLDYIERKNR